MADSTDLNGSGRARRARRVAVLLCTAAALLPHGAGAASTSTVLASDSVSAAVGSLSESVSSASDSVSRTDRRAAAGDYRVTAGVDIGRDRHRLTLSAPVHAGDAQEAEGRTLLLELPTLLVRRHQLRAGARVRVEPRPYGLEFAAGQPLTPFFLALDEGWLHGLAVRPVDGPGGGR